MPITKQNNMFWGEHTSRNLWTKTPKGELEKKAIWIALGFFIYNII